jgi:ParB family transcriptional regulator, chromosome partitioning protein
MARRRLTPAQPGYLAAVPARPVPEVATAAPFADPPNRPAGAAPPIARVSGQSAEAAALRELAEGIETARREGRMMVDVPLASIAPGHLLRDRVVVDREALDALKASIRAYGQRVPAEITPLEPSDAGRGGDAEEPHGPSPSCRFGLISGWRRFQALAELHEETGAARFSTLRALIRPAEEAAESYVVMVEENELRVGLSYYERARLVAETASRGVFADRQAALRTLFATASRAKRSKIASFIEIHEELGDLLGFPAEIPERLGLALVAELRQGGGGAIRAALAEARPESARAEIALLERLARPRRSDVSRAKQPAEILRPGLSMQSARKGDRITVTLSGSAVDDALLKDLRAALRRLGRG